MSTLPPEGQDGQPNAETPAEQAATPAAPQAPATPEAPAAPAAPQFEAPQAPAAPPVPQVPPQAPQQPAAPQYQAPQQPAAPQYAAPQQPAPQYGAPQYQAPPTAGQYQAPPPGGTPQAPYGYQQPVSDPVSNITLNYWLSVFFSWIPALIFFFVEKDKGHAASFAYHRENLNFSLLRVGVIVATWILGALPFIGGFLAVILGIGSFVLFIFHIIAAAKAPEGYRRGEQPGFIFNVPFIK